MRWWCVPAPRASNRIRSTSDTVTSGPRRSTCIRRRWDKPRHSIGGRMNVTKQIAAHIATQPEPKRSDMQALHALILGLVPGGRLWFLDGKDETGRVVSNPNIGYGELTLRYADGTTKPFYQLGLSANTT